MPVGTLKVWNDIGFGFIADDSTYGEGDMYVHAKQFRKAGIEDPAVGDVLEYAVGLWNGRKEAVSIARIARGGECVA